MKFFMINKMFNKLVIVILLVVSFSSLAQANSNEAASFINDLAARVIDIVKNDAISDKGKEERLNDIFLSSVDTKWIGKFALGRYWRSINSGEQKKFLDLYSKYILGLYVPNFRKYTGGTIKVISSKNINDDEYYVQTKLTDPLNSMDIDIGYRVLQNKDELEQFMILDIVAEGVSLITTQRAEISSVMSGRDFNHLIKILRSKTSKKYGSSR